MMLYKEIVENMRNNDFLTNDDYNEIHIKPVVQQKQVLKKKEQKDRNMNIGI